jgi:catechol 2,3-dioxygenase-like lactoylglutathione lyase family enzyme
MTGFALGNTTLLLFQLGLTSEDNIMEGRPLPGHGPSQSIIDALKSTQFSMTSGAEQATLKQHFCLAVRTPDDVSKWDERFKEYNVPVTGRMDWEKGGRSVYFSDPDGHVGEIGSRGIWGHY